MVRRWLSRLERLALLSVLALSAMNKSKEVEETLEAAGFFSRFRRRAAKLKEQEAGGGWLEQRGQRRRVTIADIDGKQAGDDVSAKDLTT